MCSLGCGSSASLPSADVRYRDGAVVTARELKSIADSNDTLELWCCTSSIDESNPKSKVVIEKVEVSGVYARLILNKIRYLTSKSDLEPDAIPRNPKEGDLWIKLSDGGLYFVGKLGASKVKDIYSANGTGGMSTQSLHPIVKSVFEYFKTNANHYDAYYKSGAVLIEHIFNYPGDVTMTVKDMYFMDTEDKASITVELVSKTDRKIGIELRYDDIGRPSLDKAVSLKKDVPKTVVLEFKPSSKFKWFTLKCEENIYNFKPYEILIETTP
jgi:hypothetical protein